MLDHKKIHRLILLSVEHKVEMHDTAIQLAGEKNFQVHSRNYSIIIKFSL